MSENVVLIQQESGEDPFMGESDLTIIDVASEEIIDMGDVYHKKTIIKFSKTETTTASDLLTPEIKTYINSKLLVPMLSQEVSINTPAGTPTYEFKTVRNSEAADKPVPDLEKFTFYTRDQLSLRKRNIVFDSNTQMVGNPVTDLSEVVRYNSIYLTYPGAGPNLGDSRIARYFNNVDDDYSVNIFERFQILVGHYQNALINLNNSSDLDLKTVFDNFDWPFLQDVYYTISNKPVDLSYEPFLQETFLNSIIKTISKRSLTYSDILRDEETPVEYLFFRVEKWPSSSANGSPSQVFFLPITDNNKLFIDTQISENQEYYYRVTAYYCITEQEYFYSEVVDDGNTGTCAVETRPRIVIDSLVAFEGTLINVPAPPLTPHVSFHNKIDSNKIKMYLELQRGEFQGDFIGFIPGEVNLIGPSYYLPNEQIQFKYRKEAARFQAYRTSEPPASYSDFADKLIGDFTNSNNAENMVVMDNIMPNKKYYYIFRTVNLYGSLSNPTPVYEVELIKDADDSRVLVNSFLFKDDPSVIQPVNQKSFQELLKINLASQQVEFLLDNLRNNDGEIATFRNTINTISLGVSNDTEIPHKVWGRKFKFRVRSKDSGKIIDFNIKVNLIKEEDFPV